MGRDVPELIHLLEFGEAGMVGRVVSRHVQGETEPIEISFDRVDTWVFVIKGYVCRKFLLNKNFQRWPHLGSDDLGTLRVEVSAISLEMGGEQQDESTNILIDEMRVGRGQDEG
jgi:hypothetical protein